MTLLVCWPVDQVEVATKDVEWVGCKYYLERLEELLALGGDAGAIA